VYVELVMRKLSELDSLISHLNHHYGGHIIPTFPHDLYFQNRLHMPDIISAVQDYLLDLKHNKYCRQDAKFYCFIIEQHSSFPKEMGFDRLLSSATDKSMRYLLGIFTRRIVPKERNANTFLYSQK
jgi:hypothetical protein